MFMTTFIFKLCLRTSKGVSVEELVSSPYCILLTVNSHIKTSPNLVNRAFTQIYSTSFGVSLILLGLHENIPKVDQKGRKNKRKDKTPFWPKAKQRRNKKPNPTYTIGLTHSTATTQAHLGTHRPEQGEGGST
jgi:hypothetical protein